VARIICGVDVASRTLQASIRPGNEQAVFPNHPEGIVQLAAFCQQHHVELVAMEATGGYEQQAEP
jgi:transposase